MGEIWLSSDLHFGHNKEFIWKERGFSSIDEMNETIINNFNNIITPNDTLILLGDCVMGPVENIDWLKRLNGNITIIRGNHDTDNRIANYNLILHVERIENAYYMKYQGYHFYMSHYPALCGNYDDDHNLHKHMLNLCGHLHTKDKWFDYDKGMIYHVEVDAHDCKPVHIETIINDFKEKYNGKI